MLNIRGMSIGFSAMTVGGTEPEVCIMFRA
jgi:hypothetical protein